MMDPDPDIQDLPQGPRIPAGNPHRGPLLIQELDLLLQAEFLFSILECGV